MTDGNPVGHASDKVGGLMRRKIGPVPVIYIFAALACLLVVVAIRTKSKSVDDMDGGEPVVDDPSSIDPATEDGATLGGDGTTYTVPNPPAGTVVTSGATTGGESSNPSIEDNQQWLRKGVQFLVSKGTAGGTADAALQTFLNGGSLSTEQAVMVNKVIAEYGLPPDGNPILHTTTPTTTNKPVPKPPTTPVAHPVAIKQGPLPRRHVIKSTADDSYGELGRLYYGKFDASIADLLQAANTNLGPAGPFKVGTSVMIPVYHKPRYYTADKSHRDAKSIASANGISVAQLQAMNDGMVWPVATGRKVRVA